jgi:AraC-like DNA-binding protein
VLSARRLLSDDGLEIQDVSCRHGRRRGSAEIHRGRPALVLVRRGCFTRHVEGAATTLDPTLAYFLNPGEEQRYDHPHVYGDDCTAIFLDPKLVASIWGGDPKLPRTAVPVPAVVDVEHRALLAAVRATGDPVTTVDRALKVATSLLELADAGRVASGGPVTKKARSALADGAREALSANPTLSLSALARLLAVSPYHLSRVFRAEAGHTIARHRTRLRVDAALERLGGGEHDLARLAAETGFADQSHLTRVLRAETGRTPSALRALLAPG